MFCTQCGKELPQGASFCGKCGEKVGSEASSVPATQPHGGDWETLDFVYPFSKQSKKIESGATFYSRFDERDARQLIWDAHQLAVRTELQKWLDDGWIIVSEVGPAAISLEPVKMGCGGCMGWVFSTLVCSAVLAAVGLVVLVPILLILSAIICAFMAVNPDYRPISVRVSMKHPRRIDGQSPPEAILRIVRPEKFLGSRAILRILINGQEAGVVTNGSSIEVKMAGGPTRVQIESDTWLKVRSDVMEISLYPGQQLRLECGFLAATGLTQSLYLKFAT